VIGNIDEDGRLATTEEELSRLAGAPLEKVHEIREKIKTFDPVGSGSLDLKEALQAALATIPANLADAMAGWLDPLGLDIGDLHDQAATAAEQKISAGTFGAMASRFHGAEGAFAYLLFILLYMPCTAAVAAIYQEAGSRWALFVGVWTTGLGYGVATIYFQAATWREHPGASAQWITLMVTALVLVLLGMRRYGLRQPLEALAVQQRF